MSSRLDNISGVLTCRALHNRSSYSVRRLSLLPGSKRDDCYFTGSVLQVIGYSIESAALPFPAFVLGYAINGIGLALQVCCLYYEVSLFIY